MGIEIIDKYERIQIGEEQDFFYRMTNTSITPRNINNIVDYLNSEQGLKDFRLKKGNLHTCIMVFDEANRVYYVHAQSLGGTFDKDPGYILQHDMFEVACAIRIELQFKKAYFDENNIMPVPPMAIVHWTKESFFKELAAKLGFYPRIIS